MNQVKVKICGITRAADARIAAQSGADFVGLNFYSGPRRIDLKRAAEILPAIPAHVVPVALIDTGSPDFSNLIRVLSKELNIQTFQLYGDWAKAAVPANMKDYLNLWFVLRVAALSDLTGLSERLARISISPAAILLDAFSPAQPGGTGEAFNWNWISEARASGNLTGAAPIILAGGLTPVNVAQAIQITGPWAVDVSSGVEIPEKPGIKDADKIRAFVAAVKK